MKTIFIFLTPILLISLFTGYYVRVSHNAMEQAIIEDQRATDIYHAEILAIAREHGVVVVIPEHVYKKEKEVAE